MDFALTEEDELVRRSVREVLRPFEGRRAEFREKVLRRREFPHEIWDALAEAGFLGALVPPEYGGTGAGMVALSLVVEEMARLGHGNAILILTSMDALCIARNGSEALKRRWLPRIARGEVKCCFALTEPDAGSNSFRVRTTARPDGDGWVLDGQKTYITGADVADEMLVVTRSMPVDALKAEGLPRTFGLTLFLVSTKAPGVSMTPLPTRGIEGMNQFTIHLDGVRVGADAVVGEPHAGAMALFNSLNPERILAAATACGLIDFMLQEACAYARERKVFGGTPIGAYQGLQHPLAESRIKYNAVKLLTYRAAWAMDRDLPPATVGQFANMAKYLAAEYAIEACDRAIETLGGAGFSEDHHLIYLWDVVRLLRTAPISKEMMNFVGEHVLELPRSY